MLRQPPLLLVGFFLLGAPLLGGVVGCSGDDAGAGEGEGEGEGGGEGEGEGGEGEGEGELPPVSCAPALPPLLGDDVCQVQAGNDWLLLEGVVLGSDRIYEHGRVLLAPDGGIRCVGCDCRDADAEAATRVSCPAGVISPALINPHEHLGWAHNSPQPVAQRCGHRHDWRLGEGGCDKKATRGGASAEQKAWGELRHLLGGAVTLAGAGSATGLLRNVEEGEADGRTVLLSTFPLGDSGGETLAAGCSYPAIDRAESVLGSDAYVAHVAEGITVEARNEFLCLSRTTEGGEDLTEPRSAFIHGVGLTAPDYRELVANRTVLVWSPRTNLDLYGDTALVTTMKHLGGLIALGTDWTPTGSMNMLRELACADYLNQVHYDHTFTDRELWLMATDWAARSLGLQRWTGSLLPGTTGDVAVFDGRERPGYRAVVAAGVRDVRLVLRSGKVLYGDAALVAALPEGAECEELPGGVCGVARRVCAQRETGKSLAELTAANVDSYDLFFCELPRDEPSCQPLRSQPVAYGPVPAPGDEDGDSVPDAQDSCPRIFNPPRPVDGLVQADADEDGLGDACDPCPLDPGSTCTVADPFDEDGDGVDNLHDNCPGEPNAAQLDSDEDGRGDLCDACPFEANPGLAPCPATIPEIRQGIFPPGHRVRVHGAQVIAHNASGFFLNAAEGTGEPVPAESGIWVYHPEDPADQPPVGRRVALEGKVNDYYGQLQLDQVTVTLLPGEVEPVPAATALNCRELIANPAWAMTYEGVLIRIPAATVLDPAPDPGAGDRAPINEFTLDCGMRVDDFLYLLDPWPVRGERFSSLTGVLRWANGAFKLEPRTAADLPGVPSLAALAPADLVVQLGAAAEPPLPGPLTVSLRRAVAEPVTVTVTSAAPAVLAVEAVTLPAGSTQGIIPLRGLQARDEPVVVTATLGEQTLTAAVRVVDPAAPPALLALQPATLALPAGGHGELLVVLDRPVLQGALTVALTARPAGLLTLPATVEVARGQSQSVVPVAAVGEPGSRVTVTATLAGVAREATVEVLEAFPGGLVINEVDYDQPSEDTAEFIELYNAGASPLSLAGLALYLVNGGDGKSYARVALGDAGAELAPGAFLLLHGAQGAPAGCAPALRLPVAVQNGPDAIVLFDELGGEVLDAFSYEACLDPAALGEHEGPYPVCEGAGGGEDRGAGSFVRLPDGQDSDRNEVDFVPGLPTPCAANRPLE